MHCRQIISILLASAMLNLSGIAAEIGGNNILAADEVYVNLLTEKYETETTSLPLYNDGGSGIVQEYKNSNDSNKASRVLKFNSKSNTQEVFAGISGLKAIREDNYVSRMSIKFDTKVVGNKAISVYPSAGKGYDYYGQMTAILGTDKALGIYMYPISTAGTDFTGYSGFTYNELKSNPRAAYMKEFSTGEWYNVEYILDFENETTAVYLDGEMIAEPNTLKFSDDIDCISFNVSGEIAENEECAIYLDNVTVSKISKSEADIELSTDEDGNIFFSPSDVKIDARISDKRPTEEYVNLLTEEYKTNTTSLPLYNDGGSGVTQEYKNNNGENANSRKIKFNPKTDTQEVFGGIKGLKALKDSNNVSKMSVKFDIKVVGNKAIALYPSAGKNYDSHGQLTAILGTDKALGVYMHPISTAGTDFTGYSGFTYNQLKTNQRAYLMKEFSTGEWHNVEYILDFENKSAKVYLNGELIADPDKLQYPDAIDCISFNVSGEIAENEESAVYLDNVNISNIKKIEMSDDEIEKNSLEYSVKAKVVNNETEEIICEAPISNVSLSIGEEKILPIKFDLAKYSRQYGLFRCDVECSTVALPKKTVVRSIRFSVAKEAKEQNQRLGMHTQFGHGYGNAKINSRLLKKAGFSAIRDYVDKIQCYTNGSWVEPTAYNNWKDHITGQGLNQIIQIGTTLASGETEWPRTEAQMTEAKSYAADLVKNLSEDGVYCYELWNEVNSYITGTEYADIVMEIVPAMREANPNIQIKIAAPALAGISNYHGVNFLIDFFQRIIDSGKDPHDYIDYISVHPYKPLNQAPEKWERTCECTYGTESYNPGESGLDNNDTIPGNSSMVARFENLLNRLKTVGCDDIPMIATEAGWYSLEDEESEQHMCETCRKNMVGTLSEIGQAQYILRGTALMYNYVEHIDYHTLNNKPSTGMNYEINYGFTKCFNKEVEIPFEAKPAYIAISNFNALLANAVLDPESECNYADKDTEFDYVFIKDSKKIHMLWTSEKETRTKTINLQRNEEATIYDMYGNEIGYYSMPGDYELEISGSPIYAEVAPYTDADEYIKLVDEKGKIINRFKIGQNVGVRTSFVNDNTDYIMMCAIYNSDNVLIGCKVFNIDNTQYGQRVEVNEEDVNFSISQDTVSVKVILWERATFRPKLAEEYAELVKEQLNTY